MVTEGKYKGHDILSSMSQDYGKWADQMRNIFSAEGLWETVSNGGVEVPLVEEGDVKAEGTQAASKEQLTSQVAQAAKRNGSAMVIIQQHVGGEVETEWRSRLQDREERFQAPIVWATIRAIFQQRSGMDKAFYAQQLMDWEVHQ